MTTEEITQGNKLIAEFMGWKERTDPTERFFGDWYEGFNRMTEGIKKPLLFHGSWDWLMPVVAKLEQMPDAYEYEEFLLIRDELCTGRIETVFSAVVDCIEYQNSKL